MTYSLYTAPLQFERSADQLVTGTLLQPMPFQPASLDLVASDLRAHGCLVAWNPQAQQCVLVLPPYVNNWYTLYTIPNSSSQQTYRLSVNATGYYGSKNYGLRLTDLLGLTPPSGVRIFAWNNMCVYFATTGTTSVFDLGEIPADYAGKTLNFSLFDPGDSSGSVEMEIINPSGNAVKLPAWVRTVAGSNGTELLASNNGDRIYNGLWLNMPITIPANYNPTAGNDWWQIEYLTPNGTPTDKITISISLSGSPVHLVNEIP